MSLEVASVPIVFTRGVDTKTDPKVLPQGALSTLENAVFTSQGILSKRHGYDLLSKQIEGSAAKIASATGLATYGDELLLFDGASVFSYAEATGHWTSRGPFVSLLTTSIPIVRTSSSQANPDIGILGGIRFVAWEEGGIHYSIQDAATDAFIVSNRTLPGGSSNKKPKIVSFNGRLVLLFVNAGNLSYCTLNPMRPSTLGAAVAITSDLDAVDNNFDALATGERLFIAYNDGVAVDVALIYLDTSYAVTGPIHPGGKSAQAIGLVLAADEQSVGVLYGHGHEAYLFTSTYSLSIVVPITALEAAAVNVTRLTGYVTATSWVALYELANASPTIRTNSVNRITHAAGAAADFARGVGLASKAWTRAANWYVLATFASDLQPTYFALDASARVVAKLVPGAGGGLRTTCMLSEVPASADSADAFELAHLEAGRLASQDGTLLDLLGVSATRLDFSAQGVFRTAELSRNLLAVGGVVQSYDGVAFVETGFHLFPEGVIATPGAGGSGSMGAGTYGYAVIYEWTDNQGQVHRSAPSPELSAVAVATGSVSLSIPTLRLTARAHVRIAVYRTLAGATILHRLNPIDSPLLNDPTADTVTYVDTASDAGLTSNELLYTAGGSILESIAPPAAGLIATYKNRVMLAGLADGNTIAFSTATPIGEPVYFNDGLTLSIDARGGPITALAVIDGTLVVFKRDLIFALTGDGPNNGGFGGSFSPAQLITSDAGCTNQASIVQTPIGLMFQSPKGLYLLDRSLQCKYLGSHVEAFNDAEITGACLVPNTNQVRFTISSGDALVYDYLYDQWCTFTNHAAVACVAWDERFTFARADGQVCRENTSSWTDGPSTAVKLRIVTGWINVTALQGFQRVRKVLVLGDYRGAHKLVLQAAFDYSDTFTDSTTIDATAAFTRSAYGSIAGAELANGYAPTLEAFNVGAPIKQFNDIFGLSSANIWAVGSAGLIAHWDGNAWTVFASGTVANLLSVWASGPTDVWTVGTGGTVRHYDGVSWGAVTVPGVGTTDLRAVKGSASNNVWITANGGAGANPNAFVAQWDGATWVNRTTGIASAHWVRGLIVVSPTRVYALGNAAPLTTEGTSIDHWDGSAWTSLPNPGTTTAYSGVEIAATGELYIPTVGANPIDGGPEVLYSPDGLTFQRLTDVGGPGYLFADSASASPDGTIAISSTVGLPPLLVGNAVDGFVRVPTAVTSLNGVWIESASVLWGVTFNAIDQVGRAYRFTASLPYGASSPYGGSLPYQFERRLARQKCQAIRISIEDAQSSSYNEGCAINGITLEIGVKRGTAQVPANRSY